MQASDRTEEQMAVLSASPRLFRNALLDRMSRVHHLVPLVLYGPLVLVLAWTSFRVLSLPTALTAVLAGYLSWTLVEYFGHRFLFHLEAQSAWGARLHYLIHGVHHEHPNDPLRLVMPPLMSLPILATALGIFLATFGAKLSPVLLAGFMIGYLAYDMLHFHVHHGNARTRVGRLLKRRHMYHHFRDGTSGFGVSAPWWDEVFGTRPERRPFTRK